MSKLKARKFFEAVPTSKEGFYQPGAFVDGYLKSEVDAAIGELKDEIYNQKWRGDEWARNANDKDKQIDELKGENRMLKRALWLARAERAKEMCKRLLIQGFDPKWEKVERKCRAKAESYK